MKTTQQGRRGFLKSASIGALTLTSILNGCRNKNTSTPTSKGTSLDSPKGKMTYRTDPQTGEKVSLLGFGMMKLPTQNNDSPPDSNAPIDQERVNQLVDYALDHGVNLYATSPAYCNGQSETATGNALSRHPRNNYLLSTQLSNINPATWSRKASQEMFRKSLKCLQTEYVDYLFLNEVGMGDDPLKVFNRRYIENGILDWLVEQRKKGIIKHLGFSFHGDISLFDLLLQWHDEGKYHFDCVLIELNYLEWNYANEINPRNTDARYLYGELEKRQIPAFVMEPLLGGCLASLPQSVAMELKRKDYQKSITSWAFRYAGTRSGILSVLSDLTYMEQLKDALLSYCPLVPLSESEMRFLHKDIAEEIVGFEAIPCIDCKYCMPCPYGLDIPAIFTHYNKMKNEGRIPVFSQDKDYARYRREFLIGYNRSVPSLRQADHCIGCGECVGHCPQHIAIPQEMKKIDRFVEQLKQGMS